MNQNPYKKITLKKLNEMGEIDRIFEEAPPEINHSHIDHMGIASSLLPLLYAGIHDQARYIDDFVELQRYAQPLLEFQEIPEFEDPKESPAFVVREVYKAYIARQEARERQEKDCTQAMIIFDNISAAETEINKITERYFPRKKAPRKIASLNRVLKMSGERNHTSATYATN